MNNRRLDLNLLHIFRAVMEERNVSRAADRLAMTQPAVSNALNRLRDLFDDEMFTRVSGGMKPTQKAIELWPAIHDALERLASTVSPGVFDPATTNSTFRFAITDSLTPNMVSRLAILFARRAPSGQLQFHHHSNLTSTSDLLSGELDCAIGMFPRLPSGLNALALMTDDYVCVMRAAHPLAKEALDIQRFASALHVLMKPSGSGAGAVDHWLGFHGRTRRIAIVVNHFSEALQIVRAADLLTCMPRKYLEAVSSSVSDIVVRPLPYETERILYKLAWHDRCDRVAEQVWFRSLIRELFVEPDSDLALEEPNTREQSQIEVW